MAATIGSVFGYFSGKFLGTWLQRQPNSWLYRREYIDIAREYHSKYKGMAFVIGRFLPIVRTFVPILSGIIRLPFASFMFWNVIGCLFWVPSMISIGYFLAARFPEVQQHLEKVVIFLVVITSIPVIVTFRKERKKKKENTN
jgi:membrane-associated protein